MISGSCPSRPVNSAGMYAVPTSAAPTAPTAAPAPAPAPPAAAPPPPAVLPAAGPVPAKGFNDLFRRRWRRWRRWHTDRGLGAGTGKNNKPTPLR